MHKRLFSWIIFAAFLYLMISGSGPKHAVPTPLPPAPRAATPTTETLAEEPSATKEQEIETSHAETPSVETPGVETPTATPPPEDEQKRSPTSARDMRTVKEFTDRERWKRALNPEYAAHYNCTVTRGNAEENSLFWHVSEDRAGIGSAARCSETIPIAVTVWSSTGQRASETELSFTLGTQEFAAGLDAALIGIRPGGIRTIILSPEAQTRKNDQPLPKSLAAALGKGKTVILTAKRMQ